MTYLILILLISFQIQAPDVEKETHIVIVTTLWASKTQRRAQPQPHRSKLSL